MSGQSVIDRLNAAKHSLAGQGLAKSVCKATTEEVIGPKRKHLDYLLQCTNEPNVSTPQLADLLIERMQSSNWVVVFKGLITVHNVMNYGNEKFFQYLASNNCSLSLENFVDKSHVQGFDMSTYIRKYAKYINEKAVSYRALAYDLCKVKKGKEDGLLRTLPADKLLKTLTALQNQVDALLEFDATPSDMVNGVISAAFLLLWKDLIRLFTCYNDGIMNLLEKYFELNKRQCREALDLYKKFLLRMDKISAFLKGAEPWTKKQNVGLEKDEIPDLAKAPASLLETLEAHLATLEAKKKKTKKRGNESEMSENGSPTVGKCDGGPSKRLEEVGNQADDAKEKTRSKGDTAVKSKTKKKATKEQKEDTNGGTAATAPSSPLPSMSSPPPRPPAVSKPVVPSSPLHPKPHAGAGDVTSAPLLLLGSNTKPSDDLLALDNIGLIDVNEHKIATASQEKIHHAPVAVKTLVPDKGMTDHKSPKKLAPSSMPEILTIDSNFLECLEVLEEKEEKQKISRPLAADLLDLDLLDISSASQMQQLPSLPQQLMVPAKKASTECKDQGLSLLDLDGFEGDSTTPRVVPAGVGSSGANNRSNASIFHSVSAGGMDLLGSPADISVLVSESSSKAVANLEPSVLMTLSSKALLSNAMVPQSIPTPHVVVESTSASSDLLELFGTPSISATVSSHGDQCLAACVVTPTGNEQTDLLSLDPELAELDSLVMNCQELNVMPSPRLMLSSEATTRSLSQKAGDEKAHRTHENSGHLKEEKQPAAQGHLNASGRPSPPPYSPRDPLEMAMMKNITFGSPMSTKSATVKPSLASMQKQQDGGRSAETSITSSSSVPALEVLKLQQAKQPITGDNKGTDTAGAPLRSQKPSPVKSLVQNNLDTSLASLADNLTVGSLAQNAKGTHQWNPSPDKKLTGGSSFQSSPPVRASQAATTVLPTVSHSEIPADIKQLLQKKPLLTSQPDKAAMQQPAVAKQHPNPSNEDPFGSL